MRSLQGEAVEKLHGNEGVSIFSANFVDGAYVGMVERRRRARLAAKALQGLRVVGELVRQKLQSDKAAELDVLRLVNDSHATAAELLQTR